MHNAWPARETRDQPPCSRCGREPRYPGQRWGKRCFALYHRDRRAQQRHTHSAARTRHAATTSIIPRAYNTPLPLFEQVKRVVLEITKYRHRPETIRVSLFPRGAHLYVDLRIYLAGRPTRKGLALHMDLVPAVIRGLQQARRTAWDALPRQEDIPAPVQRHGQTAVHWPEWP